MDLELRQTLLAFEQSPSEETAAAALVAGLRSGAPDPGALGWLLALARWGALSHDTHALVARAVALHLAPDGFELQGLETYELGPTKHEIAVFQREGRTYSLIPAGRVELGFDVSTLELDAAQLEDVQGFAKEMLGEAGLPADAALARVKEMFASSFTPVRTVELEPLLVEQRVRELDQGLAALGVDAEDDDWLEALYERDRSLEDLRGQGGLRLPTTDEWELACGGGSRRLFRWGSEASATRSPYDDPGPAALPNAFGLSLPSDTYAAELCASEETRGGDGGGLVCGGCTDFLPWLSLATAFDPRDALVDVSWEEMDPGIRLVRSLDLSR